MKAIVGYFSNIWKIIQTLVGLVIDLIVHFIDILGYIAKTNDLLLDLIDTAPVYIKYFAIITLLVSIIFLLLGRNGGKA